ncbi:MAG: acyl-CoA/acyl-ACP dehydrogenase [Pseudomonadales bacterium]|nr:acyl-CoA/acyl-ACP dehydrogenase [Pseudomonadales bacterium]MDP4764981.1 acyl-CoA/acyl-ACP dehydrogenase [Pseudomonadales bacterium]MDP4876229.1 acyl-CoA/acyl-ACP dehydrogenase [Pseudomonadales bacterium]MDP4911206.1 acyl-CoA/acyl-ACP dehydrogenase [Pseudomonadales bacterium]MDP5058014.1 acyl-CoA/acyl-ACP dehydrogenase [Pseudomonadales bacterium]
MEFGLSAEQTLLQDTVTRFLEAQAPLATVRRIAAGDTNDKEIWRGMADLGIPGLLIPEALGGVGLGILDAAIVAETLGYHVTPAPFIGTAVMAPLAFMGAGTHSSLLGTMAQGDYRVGIAMSEAIGARNDAGVRFAAGKLSGKSIFVLDSEADGYLVATRNQHLYFVAATAPGLQRQILTTVDKTRTTCELRFNQVDAEMISTDPAVYIRMLDAGRVMQAADTLGAAQCALDQAVAYAKERKQFGRVIGSFQAVKHLCAEMAAGLEPCRALVWYAAHAQDHVPEEARMMACHAKAHLAEVGQFVAKTATEVHGGMGFTDLVGLHFWFKRIGANRQLLGSPALVRAEAARVQGLCA